ncbi:hypothetical protein B0H34DRAFT_802848 [Crassisporium funariophilum]|nr:hypothetical protein B0H34DRAFT_802848 [Crassisporium funariophilum]
MKDSVTTLPTVFSDSHERGHFFGSTRKLSKVFGRAPSAKLSHSPSFLSLREFGCDNSASFKSGQPATLPLSPTVSPSGPKSPKKRESISPAVVSSILNSMYAYPATPESPVSSQYWGEQSNPLRRTTSHNTATSICTSPSQNAIGFMFLISDVAAESSRGSSEAKSQRSTQTWRNKDKEARTRTFSGTTLSTVSHRETDSLDAVLTNGLLPEAKPPSMGSQDSVSQARVVGRGGSGSRPRQVSSATSIRAELDQSETMVPIISRCETGSLEIIIANGRLQESKPPSVGSQEMVPHLRVVGRGGSGSRLRQVAQIPTTPAALSLAWDQSPESLPRDTESSFFRPAGRGGAGSLQRPVKPPINILHLLHKRKQQTQKDSKPKGKLKQDPSLPLSLPPVSTYRLSNNSNSTLSTIHFSEENSLSVPSFLPHHSHGTSNSMEDLFLRLSLSPTSSSLEEPSTGGPTTPANLDSDDEDDFDVLLEGNRSSTPDEHLKRSLNKLTRTLGDCPDLAGGPLPKLTINNYTSKDKSSKVFRRASLSLTSVGAFFSRPNGRGRDSTTESQITMSTLTDDLHQFDLADDLSESWGETDNTSSIHFRGPPSPITFSPPSPVLPGVVKPTLIVPPLDTDDISSPERESISVPSPTLSRSHSYTHSSRRRSSVRISAHTHAASVSLYSDLPLDSGPPLAVKSNWLVPPSREDNVVFQVTGTTPEKAQAWTGEWNRGDMQDVIRTLRTLR